MTLIFNEKFAINSQGGSGGSSFPSDTYEIYEVGDSGTEYIAPADGWFYAIGRGGSGFNYIALSFPYGDNDWNEVSSVFDSSGNRTVLLPVKKGTRVRLTYQNIDKFWRLLFYYAVSSENEAS